MFKSLLWGVGKNIMSAFCECRDTWKRALTGLECGPDAMCLAEIWSEEACGSVVSVAELTGIYFLSSWSKLIFFFLLELLIILGCWPSTTGLIFLTFPPLFLFDLLLGNSFTSIFHVFYSVFLFLLPCFCV